MKYFLYARKSTDDNGHQLLSIDAQLAELRKYTKQQRFRIVAELVESQTARKPGRPVFNAMMDDIEAGKAGGILAWHPDRLARNSVDGGRIIYALDTGKLEALDFPTRRRLPLCDVPSKRSRPATTPQPNYGARSLIGD